MKFELRVNGEKQAVDVDPRTPLLWVLRDGLQLTGTKFGCGIAQCGACTVMVNGMTRRSCVTSVESVKDADITTIEGLETDAAKAVQKAWIANDVPQCGYCQSGQVVTAAALLSENTSPTDEDIDNALAGNICRCATYVRIRKAVKDAAKALEG